MTSECMLLIFIYFLFDFLFMNVYIDSIVCFFLGFCFVPLASFGFIWHLAFVYPFMRQIELCIDLCPFLPKSLGIYMILKFCEILIYMWWAPLKIHVDKILFERHRRCIVVTKLMSSSHVPSSRQQHNSYIPRNNNLGILPPMPSPCFQHANIDIIAYVCTHTCTSIHKSTYKICDMYINLHTCTYTNVYMRISSHIHLCVCREPFILFGSPQFPPFLTRSLSRRSNAALPPSHLSPSPWSPHHFTHVPTT